MKTVLSLRPCATCSRAFTPGRPEVRHCNRCRDQRLGVKVVRVASITDPDMQVWMPLGGGAFRRNAFPVGGAL